MMKPAEMVNTTTGSPTNCVRPSEYSDRPELLNAAIEWNTAEYAELSRTVLVPALPEPQEQDERDRPLRR